MWGSRQRLQWPANCGLHVIIQYPWWGAHPGGLLPASLSRLLHLGGAGGSTYSTVIHLHKEELCAHYSCWYGCLSNSIIQGSGGVWRKWKVGDSFSLFWQLVLQCQAWLLLPLPTQAWHWKAWSQWLCQSHCHLSSLYGLHSPQPSCHWKQRR